MTDQTPATPLMQFDSHVAGKNAQVVVYPTHIEWGKTGWMGTGTKMAVGALTFGASLLATGVRGKGDTQMIPMRSITGVTTARSGLTKTEVRVTSGGQVIGFRCSGDEAKRFQQIVLAHLAQ